MIKSKFYCPNFWLFPRLFTIKCKTKTEKRFYGMDWHIEFKWLFWKINIWREL